MSSAAVGKDVVPDEVRTRDMMRCQDYLQLDPRAWTPMVIWLMNDPFSLEPPEWTDFHEAELVLTPILTEICRRSRMSGSPRCGNGSILISRCGR